MGISSEFSRLGTNHTQTPVFTERSFIKQGRKVKVLLSDSGRETAANDLAGVMLTEEAGSLC